MAKNPCDGILDRARDYCERGLTGKVPDTSGGGGLTDGASEHVKDLAKSLMRTLQGLLAPGNMWAPKDSTGLYEPFLWLGQHLAVAIFLCVVAVCGLTAWQGVPRLRQMGLSAGWTMAAVALMASIPGVVVLLNRAVSAGFTAAFASNEGTLFGSITAELDGPDAGNPLGTMLLIAMLVVALAFAALVFMTRQLGVLAFVCMAPLVIASLARGGDTSAVKAWATKLLGLMFAPFALLVISPFVGFAKGSIALHLVLLVAADLLMLRMIVHGVPYFGPRIAGFVGTVVERKTDNQKIHRIVRLGAPAFYERENSPRDLGTVDTPGRAVHKDKARLLGAYGLRPAERSSRLTTDSVIAQTSRDADRTARLTQARRAARASQTPPQPTGQSGARPRTPAPSPRSGSGRPSRP